MARLATTTDVFKAVAEPRRREILSLLARGERSVNGVADSIRLKQPQASKHLRVLKEVGLVSVRGSGQQRLYKLNGERLKPIHEWIKSFELFWSESCDHLDEYVQETPDKEKKHGRKIWLGLLAIRNDCGSAAASTSAGGGALIEAIDGADLGSPRCG